MITQRDKSYKMSQILFHTVHQLHKDNSVLRSSRQVLLLLVCHLLNEVKADTLVPAAIDKPRCYRKVLGLTRLKCT